MANNDNTYPLSFPQKSLWLISQSGLDNGSYNLYSTVKIHTNIEIPRIKEILNIAMSELSQRHNQLRSNFSITEDTPVQIIHDSIDFEIIIEDSKRVSDDQLELKIREYASTPFDLEADSLVRIFLFVRQDNELTLLCLTHHIIFDAYSVEIFLREIFITVYSLIKDESVKLPPLEKTYQDFIEYERFIINGIEGENRLKYWKEQLRGSERHFEIPTDFKRVPGFSHKGKSKIFRVNNEIFNFKGYTSYPVLLTAFCLLLSRISGNNDVTIVTPFLNREEPAFKKIIGYFVSMAFIRVVIDGEKTFQDLLTIVDDQIKKAKTQTYPFQLIVNELKFYHQANRFPLSDIFFGSVKIKSYQKISIGDDENILDIEFQKIQQASSPGDITLQFYENPDSNYIEIRYRKDLFTDETIDKVINSFTELIDRIIIKPDSFISDILKNIYYPEGIDLQSLSRDSLTQDEETEDGEINYQNDASISLAPDQIQQAIIDVWKEILNKHEIKIYDDFFSLGGQSLMAIQVIARLNKLFNIDISFKSFFENLTVHGLSDVIRELIKTSEKTIIPSIESIGHQKYYPLSFSQERMWFLHELDPESVAYNFTVSLRIKGDLNTDVVIESYKKLIHRHDSLHSNFIIVDGKPVQLINSNFNIFYHIDDLTDLNNELAEFRAREIVKTEVKHQFNLKNEPLVRLKIITVNKRNNILLLNMHHIISDEWSLSLLVYELVEIYKNAGEDNLPQIPIRYVDYSAWQRKYLTEEILQKQMDYWEVQLENLPVLQLPVDKKRPTIQTYSGFYFKRKITDDMLEKLHETGNIHGTTVYMILLTCFYILLYKYSGQEDIPLGSPVANRNTIETESLVGTFVNTLVLRGNMSGNPTFKELLFRIKGTVIDAFSNQDLPFERLVEELHPERDMSILPLAQVLFNVANVPFADNFPEDFEWQIYEVDEIGVQFDLVMAIEYEILKEVTLSYNKDLFDPPMVNQILDHYFNILEIILSDNNVRIKEISCMKNEELQKILFDWNSNYIPYPDRKTYSRVFEEQVKENPEKIAVIFQDKELTYNSLNKKSNQLARYLFTLKLGHKSVIGVYLNRSDDMLTVLLAIMKIGASYIPLDPSYPNERIVFMIEDSPCEKVITDSTLYDSISFSEDKNVLIDNINGLDSYDESDFLSGACSYDLVYTIYTSGSTGKPKGVQIEHRSLLNFLFSMKEKPGIDESDRLCAVTPLSFDISGLELFLPLITGATTVIAPREFTIEGKMLLKYIKDHNISIMQATPSTWRLLLEGGWDGEILQKVLCGGEPIPPDLVENILNLGKTIWNLYGPTETTIWSTIYHIENKNDPILIGKPIGNTEIYILDVNMRPVPVGVIGELYIGGDGVARGYLNRQELTSEKFVVNPFSNRQDGKIYRTGDLARYRQDGNIEFIGRNDFQVKVRGHRIELGEIDTVVSQFEEIKYCVTIVREDKPGDKRIVSYIKKRENIKTVNYSDLRIHIRSILPAYMIPAFFVEVQEYPLLPNGKINTKALPVPEGIIGKREIIKPQNREQKKLLEMWKEVMSLKQISIRDNFFDLGGHSILAVRLISKVNDNFNIDIPLRMLFLNPTIEEFSKIIININLRAIGGLQSEKKDVEKSLLWIKSKNELENKNFSSKHISLFPMQPRGNRPPFFIVSGVHAELDGFYRYLSSIIPSLGLDQPVYGLRPRGLLDEEITHKNIQTMAADYIKEIKLIQPKGPYFIGGECIGGLAAYEIVKQLENGNEDVGVLVLLDTFYVSSIRNIYFYIIKVIYNTKRKFKKMIFFLSRYNMNIFKGVILFITRKYDKIFSKNIINKKIRHIEKIEREYRNVLSKYRPEKIHSKIVLIVNEEDNAFENILGWENLYNKIENKDTGEHIKNNFKSIIVPGNHLTRLTVYGRNTGAVIRQVIDDIPLKN